MLMPHRRKVLLCSCLFAAAAALGAGLARVAAKSATEAPAGFNTPSFNSAQSISNGIVEPPGDTFARDQQVYEKDKAVAEYEAFLKKRPDYTDRKKLEQYIAANKKP